MFKKLFIVAIVTLVVLFVYYSTRDSVSGIIASLFSSLSPVLLGCFFAYLLNHLVSFYKKVLWCTGIKKTALVSSISVIIAIISVVGVISVFIIFSYPAIDKFILDGGVVGFVDKVKSSFRELDALLGLSGDFSLSSIIKDIDANSVNAYVEGVLNSLLSSLPSVGISFVIAVTLLFEKEKLFSSFKRVTDNVSKSPEKVKNGCGCIVVIMDGYMLAKLIEGGVTGVVFYIICVILGVPFSLLLGIIMGLFFTVPYVGGYIALIPSFVFSITVSPITALLCVVLGVVLINIVGTFISPILFKNKLKITPLTVLVSTLIGGTVFGVWGFLLAPPVVAIIKLYISVFVKKAKLPTI